MIRKARISDVREIHALLTHFADKGFLLARSLSDLYDHIRDYAVYETAEGAVAGVVALNICWENLAEIRSLAVREDHQGKGLGSKLVEYCISEAASLGVKQIFTLTYQPDFFRTLGFEEIDKGQLPHKIWADCIACPKFPDCDEVAMQKDIS